MDMLSLICLWEGCLSGMFNRWMDIEVCSLRVGFGIKM